MLHEKLASLLTHAPTSGISDELEHRRYEEGMGVRGGNSNPMKLR
ncbi:hypothetical protein [Nonomuraea africana]|uniref:Uncharacterized protein n=1 Tax=Nonomuraea africana TaxID=46171 RepID=A0ABR9KCP2_9ACTN|nr:hypothetical protein [Nonomuraea africana]MBE1559771.1 hypothetical protein [Nonomuraea africana]